MTVNSSRANTLVTTRLATPADAALLASLGATAFSDTFAADNTPENMALYLAGAFSEAIQRAELANARNVVIFAEQDGDVVGYAMLRDHPAPNSPAGVDAIEIARLYATKRLIGAGVGSTLMQRCLDEAVARGKRVIWLAVWERNPRAIAFYQRWGFADAGTQFFMLGHDQQTDRVMMRAVSGEA
jgi:GNAT superfamily N-acetyltransferase